MTVPNLFKFRFLATIALTTFAITSALAASNGKGGSPDSPGVLFKGIPESVPSHSYASAGTYTVELTGTDDDGTSDVTSTSVTVSAVAPANLLDNPGFELDFQSWTPWGSGSVIETSTVHSGVKAARVGSSAGGRAQRLDNLVVGNQYTMCAWSREDSSATPAGMGVDIYDAGTTLLSNYEWRIDWTDWQQRSVTFTYPANGDFINVWIWTDATSGFAYVDDFKLVLGASCDGSNSAPNARFTSAVSEFTVDFTDTSTDSDGSIVGWNWDFGDGNNSAVQDPTHVYGSLGTYNVSLTVTDNDDAVGSYNRSVMVGSVSQEKRLIGYFPWWQSAFSNTIEYEKFTHLNYFSIYPHSSASGALDMNGSFSLSNMGQVRDKAHAVGATISISLGGAGLSDTFPAVTANATSRAAFVQNVLDFVLDNGLDGADLDWEWPWNEDHTDAHSTLIESLDAALSAHGKLLTVAVNAERVVIRDWAIDNLDWVGIMAYDMAWDAAEHSTFADMVTAIGRYSAIGVPDHKIVAGVPFYGRNDGWGSFVDYVDLVNQCSLQSSDNYCNGHYFNGPDLVEQKAQHIVDNNYGGMMVWEIAGDTYPGGTTTSLTTVLCQTLGDCSANQPPAADAGPNQSVPDTDDNPGESASLDGSGSSDPDGTLSNYAWTWVGGSASGMNPTVDLPDGTTIITLTVTDNGGAMDSDTVTVTVTAPPPQPALAVHVGDLDAAKTGGKKNWSAQFTVVVHDVAEQPVSGMTVSGTWSDGASGSGSCLTDGGGQCSLSKSTRNGGMTFSVTDVSGTNTTYESVANHDPDLVDSAGTSITINKDGSIPGPNLPPVFDSETIDGGSIAATLTYTGDLSVSASDPNGDSLTFTKVSGPNWLSVAADGTLSGVPSELDLGSNSFVVSVSDGSGGDSATLNITVTESVPVTVVHVNTLSGAASGKKNWRASVTISVHNASERAESGVTVSGNWSGDASGSASCVADGNGACTVTKSTRGSSLTFTVDNLGGNGFSYDDSKNHNSETTVTKP